MKKFPDEHDINLEEVVRWKPKSKLAVALIATAFAATALAQQPGAAGGAAVTSERIAAAVVAAKITAQVVGIDKATRTVVLKGPEGNVVDVVAGDKVRNEIRLGRPRRRALRRGAHARAEED